MNSTMNINHAYKEIYSQYIEDASFLWLMRNIAVEQPHYDINDLKYLEQRIEAQLDGLLTSVELSWDLCEQTLKSAGGGEIFTAAIIAFKSYDQERIQKVVETSLDSADCILGLASALAWLPARIVHPWIKRFLTSKDVNHKYLAIKACHLRRENPGDYLNAFFMRSDCLEHNDLYVDLLRISGEMKRTDVLPHVTKAISHDDIMIKFWAIWASVLLGNKQEVVKLEPYVLASGELQKEAIKLAFRVLPIEHARQWVSKLSQDPEQVRNVIIATGVMGDPQAIEWLLVKMQDIQFARVAAESFSLITGVNLEEALLTVDEPENYESGPSENPADDNVELDDDENLPWPNVTMVTSYWNAIKSKYTFGQRYLLGSEIKSELLLNKQNKLCQRQRNAVALELAILDMARIHENTSAKVLVAK